MRKRTRTAAGVSALVVLALSACSVQAPGKESLETAIPEAFLASDLGITASQAGSKTSGFGVEVWASAEFEADTVTADDLRTMIELVVANTDITGVDTLELLGRVGPFEDDTPVDLGALGAELGFPDEEAEGLDDPNSFSAPWDDVVALLDE